MVRQMTTIVGLFIGLLMVMAAMWSWHGAGQLAESSSRPDIMLLAIRSAAVAMAAAAQAIFVTFIVAIIYRRDLFADVLRICAGLVAGIALISAVALGLAGR